MKYVIRPAARHDILRQFRYYLETRVRPDVADRFIAAIDTAIEQIRQTPSAGAPRPVPNPSLAGLRSWHVQGFPEIRVYYTAHGDLLRVVRVLHGKRDLGPILGTEKPNDS